MLRRLFKFSIFSLFLLSKAYSNDVIINKILYKKTLLDFDMPVHINIYLNQMNAEDVIVFFNNEEITDINKNLTSLYEDDNDFLPSFNFEAKEIMDTNILQVFVFLSQGITVSTRTRIYFEKGIIVDDNNFQIGKNKIFFVKAGEIYEDGISYSLYIENKSVLKKIEDIETRSILFYKLKSLNSGVSKLKIFKYDEYIDKQEDLPIKTISVNVEN